MEVLMAFFKEGREEREEGLERTKGRCGGKVGGGCLGVKRSQRSTHLSLESSFNGYELLSYTFGTSNSEEVVMIRK